jgi:2-polyprenyl-3-methyl-5-hydroxy-6-metoxy-1,4-benzoquinol methylase
MLVRTPDRTTLEQVFRLKYGPPEAAGWGPTLRRRFDYFQPDDHYEALVSGLVLPGTRWLDVGCGRDLFPFNHELARVLAQRAGRLTGVDPDATLDENPFVHEKCKARIDDYDGQGGFDLVTLRMVAEHIADPERSIAAVHRALAPGGLAVVYTVFAASPVPLLTRLLPMAWRHRIKAFLWRTAAKDTFPTCFLMNTRGQLRRLFAGRSMHERLFLRLDDCRTFSRFRWLLELELRTRSVCTLLHVPYPEHCILAVYQKP